jgi:hypothetical protein
VKRICGKFLDLKAMPLLTCSGSSFKTRALDADLTRRAKPSLP